MSYELNRRLVARSGPALDTKVSEVDPVTASIINGAFENDLL